mmetsp:Transcript_14991/g.42363  ORF Transcript_14991/g.42363 Transcript_14991/m.42363 type:complete len:254 (+) Transcript_14991:1302-2063(+)
MAMSSMGASGNVSWNHPGRNLMGTSPVPSVANPCFRNVALTVSTPPSIKYDPGGSIAFSYPPILRFSCAAMPGSPSKESANQIVRFATFPHAGVRSASRCTIAASRDAPPFHVPVSTQSPGIIGSCRVTKSIIMSRTFRLRCRDIIVGTLPLSRYGCVALRMSSMHNSRSCCPTWASASIRLLWPSDPAESSSSSSLVDESCHRSRSCAKLEVDAAAFSHSATSSATTSKHILDFTDLARCGWDACGWSGCAG